MKTVNITLKIDEHELTNFESWLRNNIEVVSFKILPDTEQLYAKDETFKKLVKAVKTAQRIRDIYINDKN